MRSKVRIHITQFPGSSEWVHARNDGTLIQCAVIGCEDQILFWDEPRETWVCYPHGVLVLRSNWNLSGQDGPNEIEGTIKE